MRCAGEDEYRALYRGRAGQVAFVDVPALDFLVLTGGGDPDSDAFAEGGQVLQTVSHTAHFVVKRRAGVAPRLMPLEALWWVEDPARVDLLASVALGFGDLGGGEHRSWRWQAMIMQPPGVDHAVFEQAVLLARKKDLPALDEVRFETWTEGPVAQLLHVGPHAAQAASVALLHDAIDAAGYRPRGPQHEVYLRNPWRCDPARLRTLLRLPIEPA
jgi:hypothetical protein